MILFVDVTQRLQIKQTQDKAMKKLDKLNQLLSTIKAEQLGQNSSLEQLNNNLMRTAQTKSSKNQDPQGLLSFYTKASKLSGVADGQTFSRTNESNLRNKNKSPKKRVSDLQQSRISIITDLPEMSPKRKKRTQQKKTSSPQPIAQNPKRKATKSKEKHILNPSNQKLLAQDVNADGQKSGSKKYITEKKIREMRKQQIELMQDLYENKCKNLCIPQSEQKFDQFLLLYLQENQSKGVSQKKLQLSELYPINCEPQINALITFHKATSLNLSKTLTNPSCLVLNNITHLHLNNCNLHNSQLQQLFSILQSFNKIQLLSLSSHNPTHKNHLTSYESLYRFLQSTSSLQQLHLANCSIHKDNNIFKHLKNSSLTVIDLSHNEKVIGISSSLKQLNLESNLITNPSALFTNECKVKNELTHLNVSKNPIPHYHLKLFLKPHYLTRLTTLTMNHLAINGDCPAIQEFISSSNCLHTLSMKNCQLSESSWMNLVNGLKINTSLRQLNLSKNALSKNEIAKALGEIFLHSHLSHINLSQCSIEDVHGPFIFTHLRSNKHLQHMDLFRNKLGSRSGTTLSQILKNNKSLMQLNVEDNCISYLISKQLREYISRNKYLETKNISAQFNTLSAICSTDRNKQEELVYLEQMVDEMKRQRLMMEEHKYNIKQNELSVKIAELKDEIKASFMEENKIMAEIEQIYAENESESMENSLSQTMSMPSS